MEDRGTLRQVDYVDTLSVRTGAGMLHLIHFRHQQGAPNLVRGIPEGAPSLTVWRTLPERGN